MIELRKQIGRDVITQKKRDCGQYMILMDGDLIGFLSYRVGAGPQLIARIAPDDRKEVERACRVKVSPNKLGPLRMIGERPSEPTGETEDEFDAFESFEEDEETIGESAG